MTDLVLEKLLYAYNPGPVTLGYPAPDQDTPELILRPYAHTPVPRTYLREPNFRQDMGKRFTLTETDTPPADPDYTVAERFGLAPNLRAFVARLCGEDWNDQFARAVKLSAQISANGRPVSNSRVTVSYLRETHATTLQAALDLEGRWKKRKAVLSALKAELKAIEKLGKYV